MQKLSPTGLISLGQQDASPIWFKSITVLHRQPGHWLIPKNPASTITAFIAVLRIWRIIDARVRLRGPYGISNRGYGLRRLIINLVAIFQLTNALRALGASRQACGAGRSINRRVHQE